MASNNDYEEGKKMASNEDEEEARAARLRFASSFALRKSYNPQNNNTKTERGWTPAQANFPIDETYPFLDSVVTMRAIKGYVHDENLLPCTTYSFIASTSSNWSRLWTVKLVNLFVFTLQFFSYLAVIASITDTSRPSNIYHFPANVSGPVRASQLLSLMYSILVQDNMINALYAIRNGYNEQAMKESFPDCGEGMDLKIRWFICLSVIFLMGLLAEGLTFIMIMQSSDVLGVLLNYAAVSFISTIDNRMFYLGKRGWLGPEVDKHVRLVSLADNPDANPRWYRYFFHSISILLIFGGLLGAWVFVVDQQTSGSYLPKTLRVDFSDQVHPALGAFSGFYDMYLERTRIFSSSRAVYYERRSRKAYIGYCEKEMAWTLGYSDGGEYDACQWAAKSSTTENFDVVTTVASQWYGLSGNGRTVPLEATQIREWGCSCGLHGSCVDNQCQCDDGHFGDKCSFPEPCVSLEIDGRLGSFQANGRKWSTQFEILRFENRTASVYDHPVYVTKKNFGASLVTTLGGPRSTEPDKFDIIFFTGRRWALAFSNSFYNPETDGDFEEYLEGFHAYFSNYTVDFLSEPITPITENPSPDGLSWFLVEPRSGPGIQTAASQASSAVLLCTVCNNMTNPCYYDGVCQDNSQCECSVGSAGGLCEVAPIGNGHCDPFFNSVTFDLDGGDCCEATCVSTQENFCGRDPTGFLDLGFYFCTSTDPLPSAIINGEPFSEAGSIVVLSDGGNVMAAVMANGKVGLFDKLGSEWIKRSVLNTCPVKAMAMASGPFSSNRIFSPPVVIVISCTSGSLNIFFCSTGCDASPLEPPPDAPPNEARFGDSVQISRDGGVVAVSTRGDVVSDGRVYIYRAEAGSTGSVAWAYTNETIIPNKASDLVENGWNWSSFPTTAFNSSPSTDVGFVGPPQDGAVIFEAEDAILVDALIQTTFCPCSGEGYAVLVVQGSSVEWNVHAMEEGVYEISMRYATPENIDLPCYLLVDGVQVATFNYTGTPTWFDWTVESNLVTLSPGNHSLTVRADENQGPNIDWMSIRPMPTSGSPTASTMPSAFPSLSTAPSSMPSVVPGQVIVAMSLSGSGKSLALLVGDIIDGLAIRMYVYRFDGASWVNMGEPIRETACSPDFPHKETIRLSYDGNTLLFSGGNIVKVFDWNTATNKWDNREVVMDDTINEPYHNGTGPVCRVEAIALSPDGNVVAINLENRYKQSNETSEAALYNTEQNVVATFVWTKPSDPRSRIAWVWKQREETLLKGSPKGPLALANNGRELAIGLPLTSADLSGEIRTFEYPRRQCDPGFNGYRFTFTIKPLVTRFTIKVLTMNQEVFETTRGPYFFPDFPDAKFSSSTQHKLATVVEEACIPVALCGNLTVYPTDFGGFNVVNNGEVVVDLPFDSKETKPKSLIFGNDTSACNFTG